MSIKVSDCLFAKDIKTFREIEAKANMTLMSMPVFRLIGSNLKVFIKNYAEKNSIHLKILYLPFNDNQVWGLFYQMHFYPHLRNQAMFFHYEYYKYNLSQPI